MANDVVLCRFVHNFLITVAANCFVEGVGCDPILMNCLNLIAQIIHSQASRLASILLLLQLVINFDELYQMLIFTFVSITVTLLLRYHWWLFRFYLCIKLVLCQTKSCLQRCRHCFVLIMDLTCYSIFGLDLQSQSYPLELFLLQLQHCYGSRTTKKHRKVIGKYIVDLSEKCATYAFEYSF